MSGWLDLTLGWWSCLGNHYHGCCCGNVLGFVANIHLQNSYKHGVSRDALVSGPVWLPCLRFCGMSTSCMQACLIWTCTSAHLLSVPVKVYKGGPILHSHRAQCWYTWLALTQVLACRALSTHSWYRRQTRGEAPLSTALRHKQQLQQRQLHQPRKPRSACVWTLTFLAV